ncbi:MAG TPA: ComF family protein [Dictyobacter sp.]|nr:ComF family protein [Dictyobacter sp.]
MYRGKRIIQQFLDILFPPSCAYCHKGGYLLCPTCLSRVRVPSAPLCPRCHTPWHAHQTQRCYHQQPMNMSGICAAGYYQDPLRTCIYKLKYEGYTRLAQPLSHLLTRTYQMARLQADVIIPVPLHHQREQKRGYNQAHLLATFCAEQLQIPLNSSLLIRTRETAAQAHLNLYERKHNVAHAFQCHPHQSMSTIRDRSVLIIDDVCTTGATLEACSLALLMAGAREVWGLVLARPM